ncbi:MAG TPA: cupin domain-containing protein [Roseimicrobium sp.]|nr:cupin domain-containing protein [Roseimicrobium sp.]
MNFPHMIREADARRDTLHEDWGSLSWVASEELTDTPGLTLGRVTLKPGASNPRHSHPNCDEILYVLKGRLQHETDGEISVLEPGDTLAIPAGVPHQAINVGDVESDVIVAYSSGRREFRLEPPLN